MTTVSDPGEGPGGPGPPIFLDQTKAWSAENIFWDPTPLPRPYLNMAFSSVSRHNPYKT